LSSQEPDIPEVVREELERILASDGFRLSGRLRRFLQYIVDETLAGRGDQLNAFSISQDVFDRDESFDPQTDSIVRVEAGRLRRRLVQYYADEGQDDSFRIHIPRGAYVPLFETSPGSGAVETPAPPEHSAAKRVLRPTLFLALGLGVLLVAAVAGVAWLTIGERSATKSDGPDQVAGAPKPVVAVLPLERIGSAPLAHEVTAGLTEDIVTDLSHVAGLEVIAHTSSALAAQRDQEIEQIGSELGATHLVLGSIRVEGPAFRINARLVDVAAKRQVWAERFDYTLDNVLSAQDEIARHVSEALSVALRPDEAIGLAGSGLQSLEARVLYRQSEHISYPPSDPVRITAARQLFRRIIDLEPQSAPGYAGLAYTIAIGAWFGNSADLQGDLDAVDRLAAEAQAIDPRASQAYVAACIAAMLRRDFERAVARCRLAVEARPSDNLAQAWHGLILHFSGDSEAAIEPLKTAIRLNPVDPRVPYLNMLATVYFQTGDYATAMETLQRNIRRGGPGGPHMLAYIAATHAELGELEKAGQVLNDMRRRYPGFSMDAWLQRAFRKPEDAGKVLTALAKINQS
jgi:TolB-like protein